MLEFLFVSWETWLCADCLKCMQQFLVPTLSLYKFILCQSMHRNGKGKVKLEVLAYFVEVGNNLNFKSTSPCTVMYVKNDVQEEVMCICIRMWFCNVMGPVFEAWACIFWFKVGFLPIKYSHCGGFCSNVEWEIEEDKKRKSEQLA